MAQVEAFREAANAAAGPEVFARLEVPATMRAAYLVRSDIDEYAHVPAAARDPRKTIHVGELPVPTPSEGEVLVAVMASAINYNTVWSAVFDPMPTFRFIDRRSNSEEFRRRHSLSYHIIGSDAAGVVVAVPPGERRFRPGDAVVVFPGYQPAPSPISHVDMAYDDNALAWGYETNFGGFADFCIVRADQIIPKPAHLTWEEAASLTLSSMTVYRMLVGDHGARVRLGDVVLIWGAAGGIGSLAVQYVLRSGGRPVAVVSSPEKAELVRRWGVEAVINRRESKYRFLKESGVPDSKACHRFKSAIRDLVGADPNVVFEHSGAETFAASVYVASTAGVVVTCGSTSGYNHAFDNRLLWLKQKRVIGCHGSNYYEALQANRLTASGVIHPVVSKVCALADVPYEVEALRSADAIGKIAVLCLADKPGDGVRDPSLRATLLPQLRNYVLTLH